MKVKVNKDSCIGCGACAAICEGVFEIGDDGLSKVKLDKVPEDKVDAAKEAIESCPTAAIEEVKEEK